MRADLRDRADRVVPKLLIDFGYVFGVMVTGAGDEVARWGNIKELEEDGIIRYKFWNADARKETVRTLGDESMPQIEAQGRVRCVLLRPEPEVVIALFEQKGIGPAAHYREAKEIWKRLEGEWLGMNGPGERS